MMKRMISIIFLFVSFYIGAIDCKIPNHIPFEIRNSNNEIIYEGCYDPINHGPHLISYTLTREMILEDAHPTRPGFTTNRDVVVGKPGLRAELESRGYKMPTTEDYVNSGWERGHMAPAEDFDYSQEDYSSTFFMGNVWPQDEHCNNPGAWYVLEKYERDLALRYRLIKVVIEVVEFSNLKIGRPDRTITVPLYFRKKIYFNNTRESFRIPNISGTPTNLSEVKYLLMEE
jgi:hypothetical protein